MPSVSLLLQVAHFVGFALALGAGTVKSVLLLKARSDAAMRSAFLAVSRTLTRVILAGVLLLVASGVGWLVYGYELTPLLIVKIALVAAVFGVGPIIDKVADPRFRRLAPRAGEVASAQFLAAHRTYVLVELTATGLFYVITVLWLAR